ncbi:Imm7 family immunity protein [Actinophytocola sp.]|uniref:Imm7 family immunity protein n=1 Tax=Actinophytocola sp. TaxID=1872138 RepID=UPI002ED413C4
MAALSRRPLATEIDSDRRGVMYEVHGWLNLSESTYESDVGSLETAVHMLRDVIEKRFVWPNIKVELIVLNGQYMVTIAGCVNRPTVDAIAIHDLIKLVATKLPGSWGLLYEYDSEAIEAPGFNAYQVTRIARGRVEAQEDPFLSPINPMIED